MKKFSQNILNDIIKQCNNKICKENNSVKKKSLEKVQNNIKKILKIIDRERAN